MDDVVKALAPFVLVVVMFLVLTLPVRRQRRRMQALIDRLHVGDEVMMQSGQYGRVHALGDQELTVEISPGVLTRWAKGAVAAVVDPASQEPKTDSVEPTDEAPGEPSDPHSKVSA